MLLYFAVALLGVLFLVVSAVFGEVFDFLDGADGIDGDVHPFSGKVVAVGMTAFGATGMIATYYDWGPLMSALTSALAALFLGAVAWWIIGRLFADTASTDVAIGAWRGRRGQVTVGIPPNSVGEVLIAGADSTHHMIARSRDGSAIPAGTSVRIVETLGSAVVVERADQSVQSQSSEPLRTTETT